MADSKQDCITLMANYKQQERMAVRQRRRMIRTREQRIIVLRSDLRSLRAESRKALVVLEKISQAVFEHALSFEVAEGPGLAAVLESGDHAMICKLKFNASGLAGVSTQP